MQLLLHVIWFECVPEGDIKGMIVIVEMKKVYQPIDYGEFM